jgi:hypothetical protein
MTVHLRKSAPTENLSPLSATLTKYGRGRLHTRRSWTSFVGAQHAAPLTPGLPIQPGATSACRSRREPTPTVNLTLLSATLTKNAGVPVEP